MRWVTMDARECNLASYLTLLGFHSLFIQAAEATANTGGSIVISLLPKGFLLYSSLDTAHDLVCGS